MILLTMEMEKKGFQEIYHEIRKTKKISEEQKNKMEEIFGSRFNNAYKTLLNRKVRKYIFNPSEKKVWVVIGKSGSYQILPSVNFCSCNDFYFRVIGQEIFLCYHLIAQKLAYALDKYEIIEKEEAAFESLIKTVLETPSRKNVLSIEELKTIRNLTSEILSKVDPKTISQILDELKKVNVTPLTTRQLSAVLVADKKKRFQCLKGQWTLSKDRER
jgi:predicted nucleic acid-binding Zn finger protein